MWRELIRLEKQTRTKRYMHSSWLPYKSSWCRGIILRSSPGSCRRRISFCKPIVKIDFDKWILLIKGTQFVPFFLWDPISQFLRCGLGTIRPYRGTSVKQIYTIKDKAFLRPWDGSSTWPECVTSPDNARRDERWHISIHIFDTPPVNQKLTWRRSGVLYSISTNVCTLVLLSIQRHTCSRHSERNQRSNSRFIHTSCSISILWTGSQHRSERNRSYVCTRISWVNFVTFFQKIIYPIINRKFGLISFREQAL